MKRKRKVIFVGKYKTSGNIYSIQNVSYEVFKIRSSKENSDYICYFDDGKKYSIIKKLFGNQIESETINGKILRVGITIFIIYLFKNRNSTIHIISFEKLGVIAVILKKILNLRVVYTIHGIDEIEENYFLPERITHKIKHHFSKYLLHKYSDTIVVPSNIYKRLVIINLKIPEKKVIVIPNGVSKCFFRHNNKNIIIDNIKIFSSANPKWKTKGYDFLLNIIENLDINCEFNIICSKEDMVDNLINSKFICYDNMPQEKFSVFLTKMNVVLITSKVESFSMLTVESMALGKIVIITDTTGASEFVENKINGFIVKYSDTEQVVSIINELYHDPELLENISSEARKIYNILNWETVYNNYYAKLYSKI